MKFRHFILLCIFGIAQAQPPTVIKTETRVVLVDAVVTDKKGAYVHDLTPKDFHVWEDNKEQSIQSLTLESAAEAASTSYTVVLFDYVAMDAAAQALARQAASRFIDANAGVNRRIAIASFDDGLHISQSFTDNAGRLKESISGAKSRGVPSTAGATSDLDAAGRFYALERLAASLKDVPGRKTILLFTGHLIAPKEQKSALASAIEALNRANTAVYPIDVQEVSISNGVFAAETAGTNPVGSPRVMNRGIGRGSTSMDAAANSSADPILETQQFIGALASGTGGFVIRNPGEMPGGLQKIGEEQQAYYLIGYTPPEAKEGSCHALRVKIERSGLNVRARSSYCTGKALDLVSVNATQSDLEKRAASGKAGAIGASMQLPFFYTGPGVARVNLAAEIQPEAIKFENKKGGLHADVNILGIASTADGGTGARFNDTLTLDFADAAAEKEKPIHYDKQFKIAPGQYTFTMVFSAGGESFGKLEQPLVVEPYQAGQFAISALAFSKEVRNISDASSPLGASLFDDRAPLTVNGVELVPSGSNAFGKSAYCYLEIYTPDHISVEARILNAAGQTAWDGGATKLDPPSGKAAVQLGLTLPVSMLPAGAYRLEVTATNAAGAKVERTGAFEVKP